MAMLVDSLMHTTREVNGKWVIARPIGGDLISRLHDAWLVLIGKADAVTFAES